MSVASGYLGRCSDFIWNHVARASIRHIWRGRRDAVRDRGSKPRWAPKLSARVQRKMEILNAGYDKGRRSLLRISASNPGNEFGLDGATVPCGHSRPLAGMPECPYCLQAAPPRPEERVPRRSVPAERPSTSKISIIDTFRLMPEVCMTACGLMSLVPAIMGPACSMRLAGPARRANRVRRRQHGTRHGSRNPALLAILEECGHCARRRMYFPWL